jgi:hypothetical protein
LVIVGIALGAAGCSSDDSDGDTNGATSDASDEPFNQGPNPPADAPDCATVCRSQTGGRPFNNCRIIDGKDECVFTCNADSDCDPTYYTGCTAQSADGTRICEWLTSSTDGGSDANQDDGGSDATLDAGADVGSDIAADGSADALADVSADGVVDAAADVGPDGASDAVGDVVSDVAQDVAYDGPAAGCTATGGTISAALCCTSTSDFPNTCSVGVCGCSPGESHGVTVCDCPASQCFDGTQCRPQ